MNLRVICFSTVLSFISVISLTTSLRLNLNGDVNYTNIASCVIALYLTLRVSYDSTHHRVFFVVCVAMMCGVVMSGYQMPIRFSNNNFDAFIYLICGTLTTYINHCHHLIPTTTTLNPTMILKLNLLN